MAIISPTAMTATATNAAILSVYQAGGGTVYCEAGQWVHDVPIEVRSAVTLIGEGCGHLDPLDPDPPTDPGRGTFWRQPNGTNLPYLIAFRTSSDGIEPNCRDARIKAMAFDGNRANNTTGTVGLKANVNPPWDFATQEKRFDKINGVADVQFWNLSGVGLDAQGRSENTYTNMYVRNAKKGFVSSADTIFIGCIAAVTDEAGLVVPYQGSVTWEAGKIWWAGRGDGAVPGSGHGALIEGCDSGSVRLSGQIQDCTGSALYVKDSYEVSADLVADSNSVQGAGTWAACTVDNSYGCRIDVRAVERQTTPTQKYAFAIINGSQGNNLTGSVRAKGNASFTAALKPGSDTTNNWVRVVNLGPGAPAAVKADFT